MFTLVAQQAQAIAASLGILLKNEISSLCETYRGNVYLSSPNPDLRQWPNRLAKPNFNST